MVYGTAMSGFEASTWSAAVRLTESMRVARSAVNLVLSNALISALFERWRRALEAFRGLEQRDSVSFGAALSACGSGRRWREALGDLARAKM